MRPPFAYYGGKVGLADRIVSMLPPHETYIEPFFGSGAVLFAKRPARHEIVNDLDASVATFFRILRDQPDELERVCRLTPYSRAEWAAAFQPAPPEGLSDLERARRLWVRVNQSFSHAAGPRSGWSVTTARTQAVAATAQVRIDRFAACAQRLAMVAIEQCDGAELVERLATERSVVYVDPPYLASVRRGGRGVRSSDYACDMEDDDKHRRLATVLHTTPATVVLSGYHSPLYWERLEVPVLVHASNAVTAERGERMEVLWSNRPLEPDLHLFMEEASQ